VNAGDWPVLPVPATSAVHSAAFASVKRSPVMESVCGSHGIAAVSGGDFCRQSDNHHLLEKRDNNIIEINDFISFSQVNYY
jgi:hypothetical protein